MPNVPLYHGTDARIWAMSDDERKKFFQVCQLSVDFLWQIFDPYYNQYVKVITNDPQEGCWIMDRRLEELRPRLTIGDDETKFLNLYDTLTCVNCQKHGNQQYQYGDLYLTNDLRKAINYAGRSFAFGEIGRNAYRMLDAAQIIGFPDWNPPSEVQKALDKVRDFAEAQAAPIILEFADYDVDLLRRDDLQPLSPKMLDNPGFSFRYLGSLSLENAKRIELEDAGKRVGVTICR